MRNLDNMVIGIQSLNRPICFLLLIFIGLWRLDNVVCRC